MVEYQVLLQVVRQDKANFDEKITLRQPTNEIIVFGCFLLTTQHVILPRPLTAPCVLCDSKNVNGFPTLNISWNGAGEKVKDNFEKHPLIILFSDWCG